MYREEMARTLRDQVAGSLGTQISDVEHYEVAIALDEARGTQQRSRGSELPKSRPRRDCLATAVGHLMGVRRVHDHATAVGPPHAALLVRHCRAWVGFR